MPSGAKTVSVLLFASAREAVGRSSLTWAVPTEGVPSRILIEELARRYPRLAPTLRASRFVRNGRYVEDPAEIVRPGDEFAVHPPYGGG